MYVTTSMKTSRLERQDTRVRKICWLGEIAREKIKMEVELTGGSWKRIENLKASQYQSVIITAFRELVNRLDKPK